MSQVIPQSQVQPFAPPLRLNLRDDPLPPFRTPSAYLPDEDCPPGLIDDDGQDEDRDGDKDKDKDEGLYAEEDEENTGKKYVVVQLLYFLWLRTTPATTQLYHVSLIATNANAHQRKMKRLVSVSSRQPRLKRFLNLRVAPKQKIMMT